MLMFDASGRSFAVVKGLLIIGSQIKCLKSDPVTLIPVGKK